jgi:tetratricopeptide (TPR) repeat protein
VGECLRIQGQYEEARHCYEQALEIRSQCRTTYELPQERHLLAMLCVKIGETWYDTNNLVQAQQCYELGEQVLQDAGIVLGTAKAHLRLEQSYIYWHQGYYERAFLLAQEALFLFKQVLQQPCAEGMRNAPLTQMQRILAGDPVDLGRTHVLLGMIHIGCGRYGEAHNHHHGALAIFERYHCQRETAISCCDLGDLYLKRADYAQAQSMLQRSLSLTEHMGDMPLIACVLLNLGLLQTRKGNLAKAETALRRGVILIEQLHDPRIAALLYACLATTLQEQGEVDEAGTLLFGALQISRVARMAPIIGVTLIALGQLRIEQARGVSDTSSAAYVRLLLRARNTLQRALAIPELEAETRVEGQLALALVMFLEGTIEAAYQQALQTLEMACRLELLWLISHAHCLLGMISAALGKDEQADQYFARARQGFRTRGMRLAYGRTLQQYGHFLQHRDRSDGKADRQGRIYLLKAREIFRECKARQDLQRLEQSLEDPSDTSSRELAIGKRS